MTMFGVDKFLTDSTYQSTGKYLSTSDYRDLINNYNFEVQDHTYDHTELDIVGLDVTLQYSTSRSDIATNIGINTVTTPMNGIAYPYGSYNDDVFANSKNNIYDWGFSTDSTTYVHTLDPNSDYTIPRYEMNNPPSGQTDDQYMASIVGQ